MKTVRASELSSIKMTAGNESRITCVLDHALVRKRWVGIGWVTEGVADDDDVRKYPVVEREDPVKNAGPDLLKACRAFLLEWDTVLESDLKGTPLARVAKLARKAVLKAQGEKGGRK